MIIAAMSHLSDLAITTGEHEHNLNKSLPRNRRGPDARRPHWWSSPARARVGELDALPPELLQLALAQLDMTTLMDFRLVNRRAAELAQSLPQYAAETKYAAAALHGIFRVETGRYVTLDTLFETLCTSHCDCGDFGGYVYLVTCKRVCYRCVSQRDRYLPRERTRALKEYGIKDEDLRMLPRMRLLPGTYGPHHRKVNRKGPRGILYDTLEAREVATAVLGSKEAFRRQTDRFVHDRRVKEMERHFRWRDAAEALGIARPRGRAALSESVEWSDPLRWVAVAKVPSLDRATLRPEWGLACQKCYKSALQKYLFHVLYTPDEFEEHWEECKDEEEVYAPPLIEYEIVVYNRDAGHASPVRQAGAGC